MEVHSKAASIQTQSENSFDLLVVRLQRGVFCQALIYERDESEFGADNTYLSI